MWAGKQKAVLAALGAFAASVVVKITTGADLSDMVSDPATADLAAALADLAQSAVIAAVTYAAAYLKTNRAADGTAMQFVQPDGVVVDTKGTPTGERVG